MDRIEFLIWLLNSAFFCTFFGFFLVLSPDLGKSIFLDHYLLRNGVGIILILVGIIIFNIFYIYKEMFFPKEQKE